jgi:hypothetical protein
MIEGSDGGTLATPWRRALGDAASWWAAAVRLVDLSERKIRNEKARGGFLRAGFTVLRWCGFAPDLPDVSNHFRAVNKLRKMQHNSFDKLKLPWAIVRHETKNRLPISRRGRYDIRDDVDVPLICPTRQAPERSGRASPLKRNPWAPDSNAGDPESARRLSMFYVAGVLAIFSGLFYAASHHEIGSFGVTMCEYGGAFCDSPVLVLTGAGLAACWGAFVSVRWKSLSELWK